MAPGRHRPWGPIALAWWSAVWVPAIAAAVPVGEVSPFRIRFVAGADTLQVPYARSHPLTATSTAIEHAVVLIHGTNRNAGQAYANLVAARAATGASDSTVLLLAPQFLLEEDVAAHALSSQVLFWSDSGWKQGDRSLSTAAHPRPAALSSFAVLDSILFRIASHNPGLRSLAIAGHSAGAQFVNRYAAGSPAETTLRSQFGVAVHFLVANPSSYLYFSPERAVPGSFSDFASPSPEVIQSCPGYDTYKYGLTGLNAYMAVTPPAQLVAQYASRRVTYLLGVQDIDPNDPDLDTSCAATLQGTVRLFRGLTYWAYLGHFFAGAAPSNQRLVLLPGVGHSSYDVFTSDCGAWLLMGGSYCSITAGASRPLEPGASLDCPNPTRSPATIRFALESGELPVTIRVFDVRGRLVRTLLSGRHPAGSDAVRWDGRSDHGTRAPAGVYWVRLRQGAVTWSRKITLLE